MNKTLIANLETFYEETGRGNRNILLLHGWGQSHAFWKDVIDRFSNDYHIYALDLSGFGLSQEPSETWTLDEYAEFIYKFITKLQITQPIIIGHSFGGRIAVVYASKFPVKKLVLYSNGGLPQQSLKTKLYKNIFVKIGKYFFPNFLYKSHTTIFKPKNYINKITINRNRSRRILDIYTQPSQNLTRELKAIEAKTLIIAGKKDYITDPTMGKKLHALIKQSRLIEVPNATHFSHIEAPEIFFPELENFLEDNSKK